MRDQTADDNSQAAARRRGVQGEGFTAGWRVFIGIYRAGTADLVWSAERTARPLAGFVAGTIAARADIFNRAGLGGTTRPLEVQASECASDTWSNVVPLDGCRGVFLGLSANPILSPRGGSFGLDLGSRNPYGRPSEPAPNSLSAHRWEIANRP